MDSTEKEDSNNTNIEKIKHLAVEMAKRKIQSKQLREEVKEDDVFHKMMFVQSLKHRSQVFVNRNKKTMLTYFALNRGSSDDLTKLKNNLEKKDGKDRRRQSIMEKPKYYFQNNSKKNSIKSLSPDLSLKSQNKNINMNMIKLDEKVNEIKKTVTFSSSFDDSSNNNISEEIDNIDNIDNIEKDNDNDNNEKNITNITYIQNVDESDNTSNNLDKEKYDIIYINPKKIKLIDEKKNSPIKKVQINNSTILIKNKKKARYYFDKEMKLLKLKNNKIEKKRKKIEKKNKDLFQISPFLNKKSMRIVDNNPDYRPINYKSIEEYNLYLAKVQLNNNKMKLKKKNEEKKDIEEIEKYKKLTKRVFNQSNWDEFVEQENIWQEEKRKATEWLRNEISKDMTYRPKINKKSMIIFEKMNKNNNNNYYNINDDIFTRLFNDQEKYDNKLKMKRIDSMPTFRPKLNKIKNKSKKIFKGLNNVDYTYKEITSSTKATKNNKSRNKSININLDTKNKTTMTMPSNHSQISLKYKQKPLLSGIKLYKDNLPSFSPLTTKNVTDNRKNKNINVTLEYNISKSNYDKNSSNRNNYNYKIKNNNKNNIKKHNIITNSLSILGIDEKKVKKIYMNKNKNKCKKINNNKYINNIINNNDKINNLMNNNNDKTIKTINDKRNINMKNKNPTKNKNVSEKVYINKELSDQIKNIHYKKKKLNSNDEKSLLLYNLNIRDNTSNTIRENIILTTKKYSDFFKIQK